MVVLSAMDGITVSTLYVADCGTVVGQDESGPGLSAPVLVLCVQTRLLLVVVD